MPLKAQWEVGIHGLDVRTLSRPFPARIWFLGESFRQSRRFFNCVSAATPSLAARLRIVTCLRSCSSTASKWKGVEIQSSVSKVLKVVVTAFTSGFQDQPFDRERC